MNCKSALFRIIADSLGEVSIFEVAHIDFKELYALSKKHDLAHLIHDSLVKNNLVDFNSKVYQVFNREKILAIYRYQQHNHDLQLVRNIFQEKQIQFVPLKGSILRDYYPEPWMRTCCDIDVLVKEEELEKAKEALMSLGYETDGIRTYHDISFQKGDTHIELHFNIREANKQLDNLLSCVWDYVKQFDGYEYREEKEFFVFHHIAHMAYHFLKGGCGIRPVLDLWILKNKGTYEEVELIKLLDKCHLVSFYRQMCFLCEVWFDGKQHNKISRMMEEHIVDGGVYGTQEKSAVAGIAKHKGSKIQYKLSIAFPPYEYMCNIYPKLVKHKTLLPFYHFYRFFSKCFGRDAKDIRKRNKAIDNASKKKANDFGRLIDELGLS